MSKQKRTTLQLRQIALGLVHGDICSDWQESHDDISLLSDVEALILSTQDIAMRYERREAAFEETDDGDLIFATFETLTREEALEVAEMVLRYMTFLSTPVEIEIPHV